MQFSVGMAHLREAAVDAHRDLGAAVRVRSPREVRRVDELPRNATGKVLRRVLAGEVTLEELDEEDLL